MLRRVLAILLLSTSISQAQPANQRAEAEAIHYLVRCQQPTEEKQGLCDENQINFVEQYILAKSGDLSGMGSTAASFMPPRTEQERQSDIGMPQNQVQACAWRLVIAQLQQGTLNAYLSNEMVRIGCRGLTPARANAAEDRADHLAQELQSSPAVAPPDDWCAHIPWIKGNCSPPVMHGPLDSTVTPLTADPPTTR